MATKTKSPAKIKKKAVKKKTVPAKAKKTTVPSTEFCLYAPDAQEVYLAGDFNDWQPDSKEYRLRKFKGDMWKKKVKLKPGCYEYQFVVDGQWWCDPENENRVTNLYCTLNSVIEVM